MIAHASAAPAAAQITVHTCQLQAANSASYATRRLSGYRVDYQQPRTRQRAGLIVLARSMGEALDRVDGLMPGYVMSGWGRARK
ncbi:hypothetical protein [Chromobacterium subtsugae]|uniref:hypothetical protein n=1 Tax=Chromobacterium subtsugae TaxID=251747 RepID=UPI0006415D0D|nr:hypothetical protein [Chromobacterium subtsugae]